MSHRLATHCWHRGWQSGGNKEQRTLRDSTEDCRRALGVELWEQILLPETPASEDNSFPLASSSSCTLPEHHNVFTFPLHPSCPIPASSFPSLNELGKALHKASSKPFASQDCSLILSASAYRFLLFSSSGGLRLSLPSAPTMEKWGAEPVPAIWPSPVVPAIHIFPHKGDIYILKLPQQPSTPGQEWHQSASKPFPFFHFSLAGHKLVSPDLCLNLGASKGLTTSLLCAQRCSVRQPGSQINPHYGNWENYKGNDNCLERYVTMRLDLSTWPLVRFLLQVHFSVFCVLWQHYYRLLGNLNLQAEDRLTWEPGGILHPQLQESSSNWSLAPADVPCTSHTGDSYQTLLQKPRSSSGIDPVLTAGRDPSFLESCLLHLLFFAGYSIHWVSAPCSQPWSWEINSQSWGGGVQEETLCFR